MVQITQSDRKKLEEIGVLKPIQGRYHNMNICSKSKSSNGRSIYVEDWMVIYIDPDKYRNIMKGYLSSSAIESTIRNVLRGHVQY